MHIYKYIQSHVIILVIRHHDDGHTSDRNALANNIIYLF
jgi:hypothetical protein